MEKSITGCKKMYLLYNPKSGRETIKNLLSDIIEIYAHEGYKVVVHPTSCNGEATAITKNLSDEYDLLVCCGGDGTLNEVVAGNLLRDIPLKIGYIPCGSTNDFGKTIYGDISALQAAERILKQEAHFVDCGFLEDRSFVYAAAFGLFTDISYETPHSKKAAFGHIAYLLEAAKNLGNITSHKVKTIIDGEEIIDSNFLIGMVTNSDSVGGFQSITGKNVSLQDGKFELTMITRPEKPAEYGKVLQALLDGSQNEFVIRRKIKEVCFCFKEPISFTVDGEYGGTYQTAKIQCMPNMIPLVY